MARVIRPKATKCFASRRLCNTGTGTSVTGEGLAATLNTETAAQIARSVLQQTTRRHMRHG
jgi:polyhydroxyalkanoate synthesis regulator protein